MYIAEIIILVVNPDKNQLLNLPLSKNVKFLTNKIIRKFSTQIKTDALLFFLRATFHFPCATVCAQS